MIKHGDNGYVRETTNIYDFRRSVQRLIHDVPEIMKRLGANTIVVRGKSGVAMVHALAVYISFNLLIVRKPGENSHGQTLEGWGTDEAIDKYVILDDFICTGKTVEEILEEVEHPRHAYDGTPSPVCVGVIAYSGSSSANNALDDKKTLQDHVIVNEKLALADAVKFSERHRKISVFMYL